MSKLDPYNFFFETPLYNKIEVSDDELGELRNLLFIDNAQVDAYNPSLKENTTYKISLYSRYGASSDNVTKGFDGMYMIELICVRTKERHVVFAIYNAGLQLLQKIGQFPSIASFHISKVKQYNKVLTQEQLSEFTRAIGLAANGVGIGSFVYLRRIFEGLIFEARNLASTHDGWDEAKFSRERMAEKIEMLRGYLPSFLVENKTLYGILSKGIHTLNENECLSHFEIVKVGIELILDEKVEEYEKKRKIEEAKKKLAELNSKLK